MFLAAFVRQSALTLVILVFLGLDNTQADKYLYTFSEAKFQGLDPDIFSAKLSFEQKSPQVNVIHCEVNATKYCDENFKIVLKILRSLDPDTKDCSQVAPAPVFSIPPINTYVFMDQVHKPHIMDAAKDCSNVPQFEGKWNKRSVAGNYFGRACPFEKDGLDKTLQPGTYCLTAAVERTKEPIFKADGYVVMKVENEK